MNEPNTPMHNWIPTHVQMRIPAPVLTLIQTRMPTWNQPAELAAFGSVGLIGLVCLSALVFGSTSALSVALAVAAIVLAVLASVSGSDVILAVAAALVTSCVVLAASGVVAIFAGAAMLSAFYLHDASTVMRRSAAVDPVWMRGRLTVAGGAALSGVILAGVAAAIGASRRWEAVAIPLGIVAFAVGIMALAFVIRQSVAEPSEPV